MHFLRHFLIGVSILVLFLVADTQLYKRLCPSVGPSVRRSVRPSVREHESKNGKTSVLDTSCVCLSVVCWGWVGVGGPCPPVRNDIVTPRHLFHNVQPMAMRACYVRACVRTLV